MTKFRLGSKLFTFYDETDNLKRMKDADILAEKKKPTTSTAEATRRGLRFGVIGAGLGAATGGIMAGVGATKMGARGNIGKAILSGGKHLGVIGGLAGLGTGIAYTSMKNHKQNEENAAYNRRLSYAQNQARRRERKDWKTNMTAREGYSY